MKQITTLHQLHELSVGAIIVHREQEAKGPFSILSCTPIGWEDIEFELLPVEYTSWHGVTSRRSNDSITMLGSELVNEKLWWMPF